MIAEYLDLAVDPEVTDCAVDPVRGLQLRLPVDALGVATLQGQNARRAVGLYVQTAQIGFGYGLNPNPFGFLRRRNGPAASKVTSNPKASNAASSAAA